MDKVKMEKTHSPSLRCWYHIATASSTILQHDLGNLFFGESETNDWSWFPLLELTTTKTRPEAPRREIPMCPGKPYPGLSLFHLPQTVPASVFFLNPHWRWPRLQNWEMQLAFATWQCSREPWGYLRSPVLSWPGKLENCVNTFPCGTVTKYYSAH